MSNKDTSDGDELSDHGVVLQNLKRVWGISDKKKEREQPPQNVNTDIYSVPPTARRIIPNRRSAS